MKKTYIAPELFAVELQHQDGILLKDSFDLVGSSSGEADVKAFEFIDDDEDAGTTTASPRNIWDEEW